LAAILVGRGLTNPSDAEAFLNPKLDDLHDPALLPDFGKALEAIKGALSRKEKIYVHGDYDVDGVTSAALFQRFLKSLGAEAMVHVPHRMKEGYGIHLDAVEAAKEYGARLFLTCDCGTSAHEQVARAHQAGMKVVVTDHHESSGELPPAEAVVNPHVPSSIYPFPHLSGAGVAFKLSMGIAENLGFSRDKFSRAFLDLTALGTVVDMMELTGENRIIGRFGLQQIAATKKIGLRALMQESGLTEKLAARPIEGMDLSFCLGPRLNAAGRVDDAALALELLVTEDQAKANSLARQIEELNRQRRETQEAMVREVQERLEELDITPTFIVAGAEGWHRGIVGIAAGKVVNQFHRPTLIVAIDSLEGTCHGSARSIPGFNVAEAIRAHPELMKGGGHAAAAGCSFRLDDFKSVQDALDRFAKDRLTDDQLVPREHFDADLDPEEYTVEGVEELHRMEPCGMGNQRPKFAARRVTITRSQVTKDGRHLQLWVKRGDGKIVKSVYFGSGDRAEELAQGALVDVAFQPSISSFRGRDVEWRISSAQLA
jgi:single-stranded-DNA-specific exonuclease